MQGASSGDPTYGGSGAGGGANAGPPFSTTVKPYFTECYRQHMIDMGFDLWSPGDCKDQFDSIFGAVKSGHMPPDKSDGCEGKWDSNTIQKFLKDFQAWKDGGFNPG